MNDDIGDETTGNITFLEKNGDYIYVGDLYDARDEITRFKISPANLLYLLETWQNVVCKTKPKNVIIIQENGTSSIQLSDEDEVNL